MSLGYGDSLGFFLGGLEDSSTNTSLAGYQNRPGLVGFDTSSQEWSNISTKAISYDGTAINGAIEFVPSFGAKGLLLILGGTPSEAPTFFVFDDIPILDIQSQQWSTQQASGDIPLPRNSHCTVGVEGDGTYEVAEHYYDATRTTLILLGVDLHL